MKSFLKTTFALSIILGLMQSVRAMEHKLSTISNDEDANTYTIGIVTDEDNIEVKQVLKKEFDGRGNVISVDKYSPADLAKGVVMVKRKGYEIVKLKAQNFNASDSADLDMEVLVSALSKDTDNYDLKVEKQGEKWKLLLNNKDATKMFFVTNKKFMIGTVGIKDVKVK